MNNHSEQKARKVDQPLHVLLVEDSRALRETEERFRFIVESATDYAIFTLDLDGLITSWNSGAREILGYGEHEIIGRNGRILFLPEDQKKGVPKIQMKKALSEGRAENDLWHIRKDGSLFWASGCMMTLRDDEGSARGLLVILRDRTEAKRAEETIRNALAEAEASTRAKDQFLAMLSHELRTPLTPISMAVSMLQADKKLPKRWMATLEMMQRNLKLEAHLIDDLLDLSRIIHKKVELKLATIDLHQCIQRAVEICQCDIQAKAQRVTVELAAERHHVRGDSARLQQVFWNLIKNAVKFTPDAGRLTIRSANLDEKILVAVSDTGMGIEQAMLPKIFEAFEQGDQAMARPQGGLGLGLAISKATIDAHVGQLTASSRGRGQGAVFTVELPAVLRESARAVDSGSNSKANPPTKVGRPPKSCKGPPGPDVPDEPRMEDQ
jgi:two-component system, chemotaxis family, CheB/CheR fusion protein